MHAADTSLSVQQAVDAAREAADFVLLEQDLQVIRYGIEQGRKTFANTLKYLLTSASANLGNIISMAAASLFLPFRAGPILLNNFLSDIPAVGLAQDSVDRELVDRPRRWGMHFIGRFMGSFRRIAAHGARRRARRAHASSPLSQPPWHSPARHDAGSSAGDGAHPVFADQRPSRLGSLPWPLLASIAAITCAYVAATEGLKRWFYRGPHSF
jgi:hypothetical protein